MKRITSILALFGTLSLFAPPALPWGSAVHAYINARLGDRGILQKNVVYGGMAGDVFNFLFDAPLDQIQYLYAVTHGFPPFGLDTVLPILDTASNRREQAAAFGFVTHNNVNGADVTAHGFPYNSPDGYVIAKATVLKDVLAPLLQQAGYILPEPVLLEVSHILVEYAADLLIRKADRGIGASMIAAAITRDGGFPDLLVNTYAPSFAAAFPLSYNEEEAAALIRGEEAKFRQLMVRYGTILQHGDRRAQDEVAQFLANIAPGFLKPYGIEIPPEVLLPLAKIGIAAGHELCKDDLLPKVKETIDFVQDNLASCRDGAC